ncbi:exopolyphosphatase/guanosine-5'-triphosphate,3'-diphosphate pyrophosphatase [Paenibacillus phyllosphaerae]|uniref:Exopolyphosphatase/guanosine-5'-triphosphate, 3'-diphosphate pyrophosphatase n=1 Tax=Paenibacillus phyllosphaerae TaxID=274593 RepID=A0A7W5AT37_9BACL|nr:Ppx/GppA family phosphatase [Paenibacillus phyllosphaerae]MBB3108259.1 exopolyphosphatase/guanosine-5'-triphosphate,3'-diphosphate pyrophosphatase [Paenibacillus phyllosphaerae]
MTEQRIGIIDIGSNSIRLVVYERTAHGAHRVIDGSKRAARLSELIDENGNVPDHVISDLIDMMNHFRLICAYHNAGYIRAVATAAIRNAANRSEVIAQIEAGSGLTIELLGGEQEASYGFLGMINSMDIRDGFLIDIGGGSTEVSLFRDRTLVQSVSFPFGCVNLSRRFAPKGILQDEDLRALEAFVAEAVSKEPWLAWSPGLPLVGVGGTVRSLGKIHQAHVKYTFQSYHNYPIPGQDVDLLFEQIRKMPLDKRRKLPGLSKDRVDIIVPGVAILRALFHAMRASHYLVCGAGLRDGLFYATRFPNQPKLPDVLTYSVSNLAALHPAVPRKHVAAVNRYVLQLFDALSPQYHLPERARVWLDTASTLFRIGASIDYYDYTKHTFYLMVNSHLSGLSHREMLLCAGTASYKSKNRAKLLAASFKPILDEQDVTLISMLGSLLQLAIALDRSETQAIERLTIDVDNGKLLLCAERAEGQLVVEHKEVDGLAHEFKKIWGLAPQLSFPGYR